MDSLSALDPLAWDPEFFKEHPAYAAGQALGCLYQGNKQASTSYPLSGRLYLSKSGWLLLSVPNALVRGVYDAMTAPGAELPIGEHSEVLNAHITVMTGDEVTKVGADKINERGHMFGYTLGALKEIEPKSGSQLSKVWAIQVSAPLLSALRKSYGLSALPNDDEPFHITVAVRKRGVLLDNGVAKGYETPTEVTDGESFERPISRGELKAAEEMPWRERVEVYTKHPRTGKIYGGVWSGDKSFAVPGGGIDPGETPEQAAVRELAEETGLHAANPVRLPIDPIDQPWSDKTRAEKAKIGRGNFAGSRTHFVMADYVKKMQQDKLDKWDALHRKFYTPDDALALMQDKQFGSPAVAAGRMAALRHLIANAAVNKTAAEDRLHGGKANHMPDSKFSPKALDEGKEDEREYTDNDQIAKEIAKDHLQDDPQYYKKEKLIERLPAKIASVYMQQLKNLASFREPIVYDESKPVYQNVVDHLFKATQRGDHILRGQQNMHAYKTMLDPNYRHQMAMQAIHGTSPQMDPLDKTMQLYGNDIFDTIRNWGKKNG